MHTTREHTEEARREREKQRTRALTRPAWQHKRIPPSKGKETFSTESKASWKQQRKPSQRPSGEERKREYEEPSGGKGARWEEQGERRGERRGEGERREGREWREEGERREGREWREGRERREEGEAREGREWREEGEEEEFSERLGSYLDEGCQVFTDRGWGYVVRKVYEGSNCWLDVRLEYVDDESRSEELTRFNADNIEAAAYCSIGRCLLTNIGTAVLVDFYRDTDNYIVRIGGKDIEEKNSHAVLRREELVRPISGAVGMVTRTPDGLGDIVSYDPERSVFKVQLYSKPADELQEYHERDIETPLAKYVPAAEELSQEGQLEDWKTLGKILFGSAIEARNRAFRLSNRILGLTRRDIMGPEVTARELFDKIKAKLEELTEHPERARNYRKMIEHEYKDLYRKTKRAIDEETPEGANLDNWVERFKEITRQMGESAKRDPEIKQLVTELRDRHRELLYEAIERSGAGSVLLQNQERINDLWTRIVALWADPNQKQLLDIGSEVYDRLSSEEAKAKARAQGEAILESVQSRLERESAIPSDDEVRNTVQQILARIDANRDEFDRAIDRFERDRANMDTRDMVDALHDFRVLLRRTLQLNDFSGFIGDLIGNTLDVMVQAMRRADEEVSPDRFERTRAQLQYAIDYFYDMFTFQDERDETRVRLPEMEEVIQAVFEAEERIRGEVLNAQDLRDRFRHPKHGGTAALNLLRTLFGQIAAELPDIEQTQNLRRMLSKWSSGPIRAEDLMDAFVFTISTEDLVAWTPRALDMIDAVLTKVEMVARNETLRTVLDRARESGLHQRLLDEFQSLDESLLRRVAEPGGRGDKARHEISKRFLDAAHNFLRVVVPNTRLPDVYEVNEDVEVAIANIAMKDIEFRRENFRVMLGGKQPGRGNNVNTLGDDSVLSIRTKGINTEMQDVMWKLRQLSFPYTDAHGLADIKFQGLSLHLGLKLVRVSRDDLERLEQSAGRALGGLDTQRSEMGTQAPGAARRSEQGYEIMLILKHAKVDVDNMSVSLHGSTSANVLDVITKLFTNAIRNSIKRQLSRMLRSNGILFSGPLNEGFTEPAMKNFIEQILNATINDVPYITGEEFEQLREDAEQFNKRSSLRSEEEWAESMREHLLTVSSRDDVKVEIVTDPKTRPGGGAWKHGGFLQVTDVKQGSPFYRLLAQRKLENWFTYSSVISINGVDVTEKSPEATAKLWKETALPMEVKFALDARQWRRYLSDLGVDRKREMRRASRALPATRAHLVGKGRLTLEPSDYVERATVLRGFNPLDFDMALNLRPGMILYSVADEIVLGEPYEKVASKVYDAPRPVALTFIESPERTLTFGQRPTDLVLVNRSGRVLIAGFERMPGLLQRCSDEIQVGDEIIDLDGRPFPGPFGYNQDLQRLRNIVAPATLAVGRYEGTQYKQFDVRITEDGWIGAIFGEAADGKPYIKGFTEVPGPGLSHPELRVGDALLKINDVDVSRGFSAVEAEALLYQSELPVNLTVLDVARFDQLIRVRDGRVPLTEAA